MIKTEFTFGQNTHEYRLNGYPVPSVTQVLSDILPQWRASEWHLQRGRAIHAACAMTCRVQTFEFDKRTEGYIEACKRYLYVTQPTIVEIEKPAYSRRYQFAGTPDLIVRLGSISSNPMQKSVIDWKSLLTPIAPYQLAAYGILFNVDLGMAVQLNDDGTYKCSELYNLKSFKREFLALLTAYNIRKRLKLTDKEKRSSNMENLNKKSGYGDGYGDGSIK